MNAISKVLLTGSLLASSMVSVANQFAPMQENDQKILKSNSNEIIMEVLGVDSRDNNWKKYSSYLGQVEQWVRSSSSSNKVYWYNANLRKTQLLVDFNDAIGTNYDVNIDGCTNMATIADKDFMATTSTGAFPGATLLTFSGSNCADAGLASAVFAPGVGLVSYSQQSIIGPVKTELVSAEVAGVNYPLYSGLQVATRIPSGRVLSNVQDSIDVFLDISNWQSEVQTFNFNTSQQFDIEIRDQFGTVVNKWSANKRFLMVETSIEITGGETYRFGGSISLTGFDGQPLDVGSYVVRIVVTGSNQPVGSVFAPVEFAAEAPLYIDRRVTIN
ncbi:MAG: hypothetical protein HWE27_10020 [Gammaproteobacteria bacterium]|nr:hypothetical protein [Gammaproteobacteria bacterium]